MTEGTGGFLHPEATLEQIDIRDNIQIADFGCGHGYFTIPLAKAAPNGRVFALDVLEDALQAVNGQVSIEGVSNIKTIRCNLEILGGSKLPGDSIDLVVLANILFQSQKKTEILREAKRVLREKGQLLIIEWIVGASLAPKQGWLIEKKELQQLTEKQGLIFDRELVMDTQHYGLVFKKT